MSLGYQTPYGRIKKGAVSDTGEAVTHAPIRPYKRLTVPVGVLVPVGEFHALYAPTDMKKHPTLHVECCGYIHQKMLYMLITHAIK